MRRFVRFFFAWVRRVLDRAQTRDHVATRHRDAIAPPPPPKGIEVRFSVRAPRSIPFETTLVPSDLRPTVAPGKRQAPLAMGCA
ncbi:MAG: hypothetical protein H6721_03710 [Sandaracinus sp.]|nr:hypothetical protein [Sandaracinus sp.]